MDFLSAKKAALDGALIKRPHWDNPLRLRNGRLEFVKAVQINRQHMSRTFSVRTHEAHADDWVIA